MGDRQRGADPAAPDTEVQVRGQVEVASTSGQVASIGLDPAEPPACPEALEAIRAADCVVIGPGVLVHQRAGAPAGAELSAALHATSAHRVLTLNLAPQPGETGGLGPAAHLAAFAAHAPDLHIDVVLADRTVADGVDRADGLAEAVERLGAELVLGDLAARDGSPRHDVLRLATASRAARSRSSRASSTASCTCSSAITAAASLRPTSLPCQVTDWALIRHVAGSMEVVGSPGAERMC